MSLSHSDPRGNRERSQDTSVPMPNHFSCIDCRRRKIKCNKVNPCTNCTKAQLTCSFPPPRRSRKESNLDPELLAKVRRMERIISSLQLAVFEKDARIVQLQARSHHGEEPVTDPNVQLGSPAMAETSEPITLQKDLPAIEFDSRSPANLASPNSQSTTEPISGKLVQDKGRSIYVGNTFWAVLKSYTSMNCFGEEALDEQANSGSPNSPLDTTLSDFPLNSVSSHYIHEHPSVENREKLWVIFKDSVDPIMKILHLPTTEPKIKAWLSKADTEGIPPNLNALLFAIYFAAVSSVQDDVCRGLLGSDRDGLVVKFRQGEEQALKNADFLNTDDIMVLQSFIIYLVSLRHHSPRLSWTLCPVAFRLLQSVGAHCDEASFNLSIYNSEMYRRLYWHLCLLESGASDDLGCEPTMLEINSFNAPLPRNVNDGDLGIDASPELGRRMCWTDSTLLILWADICQLWRPVWDPRQHPDGMQKAFNILTKEEKTQFIDACVRRIEEQYIKVCSPLIPIQWVTATLARMLILEFKLAASKPIEQHADLSISECDQLFTDAMECLELFNKLLTDGRSVKWAWLFKTFTLWQALAVVLTELGLRPLRKENQKAWWMIEQTMISRWHSPHYRLGHQWRCMLNLLETAHAAKAREIRRRREVIRTMPVPQQATSRASPQILSLNKVGEAWDPIVKVHNQASTMEEEYTLREIYNDAEQFLHNAIPDNEDHHSTDILSLCLQPDITGEIGDLDMIGEFDFDDDAMEMGSPSDTALLHVAFELQEVNHTEHIN